MCVCERRIREVDTGESPGFRENFGRRAAFLMVNERTSLLGYRRHLGSFPCYPAITIQSRFPIFHDDGSSSMDGSQPQLSSFSTLPLFTFNSHRSVFEYSSLITHQIFRSCNYIRSKRDRLFVPSAGFERARRVWRRVNPRLSITAKESAQRSNRAGKRAWDA